MRSQTVTAVLDADHQAVFDYLCDIERLPEWAQMAVFPTRAVPLPDGRTAYTFTLFQGPDMPDELFGRAAVQGARRP